MFDLCVKGTSDLALAHRLLNPPLNAILNTRTEKEIRFINVTVRTKTVCYVRKGEFEDCAMDDLSTQSLSAPKHFQYHSNSMLLDWDIHQCHVLIQCVCWHI